MSRLARDLEAAPQRVEAVCHPSQPGAESGLIGLEPSSVVMDLEQQVAIGLGEPDGREAAAAYFATFCMASNAQK